MEVLSYPPSPSIHTNKSSACLRFLNLLQELLEIISSNINLGFFAARNTYNKDQDGSD
jgi:hypothetical protein